MRELAQESPADWTAVHSGSAPRQSVMSCQPNRSPRLTGHVDPTGPRVSLSGQSDRTVSRGEARTIRLLRL